MDIIMKFIHGMLLFVAVVTIMLFAFGSKLLAIIALLCVWAANCHFRDRCLGFYVGRREDCSIDYVIPQVIYESENIDNSKVVDAEWEEIK